MARYGPEDQKIMERLREAEILMKEVKNEFELYFLQQVRRTPDRRATELKRMFLDLDSARSTNTQIRFKKNSLKATYGSLTRYWHRVLKQIEEGTYRRHIDMADRREKMRAEIQRQQQKQADQTRGDEDAGSEEAEVPAAALLGDARTRPQPKKPQRQLYEPGSQELMQAYVRAKRVTGEKVDNVEMRRLSLKIKQHANAIMARTGAGQVKFTVSVKDGQAKVTAVPLKK